MNDKKLWRVKGDDGPCNDDLGETIDLHLEAIDRELWPEILEIECFRQSVVPETFLASVALDRVLECLDEEFGNPDGDYSDPTDAMKAAEAVFIKAVLFEYSVWSCEETGEVERVNVLEWVRENRPDWLDDNGEG